MTNYCIRHFATVIPPCLASEEFCNTFLAEPQGAAVPFGPPQAIRILFTLHCGLHYVKNVFQLRPA